MAAEEKRRIRYAVIGLGNIAQVAMLPAFEHAKENSELVALVSSDPEKLRELGRRYGVEHLGSYDDLERIIEEARVDAVYIAVPNSLHRTMTERAARACAHVLCEKPMAMTEADCRAMIDATRRHGVKLMIAYRLHFEQANLHAVERIRGGEIGEPRIFSSVFGHQVREGDIRTRRDMGGGALFDMGIYCINAARHLFDDEPIEVYARQIVGTDERFRDVDEMTSALMIFPGERIAQMTASQGASDVSELRVVGTTGHIRLDPAYEYAGDLHAFVTTPGEGEKKHTVSKRDQFAPELVHFSQCILDGTDPVPSALEGLADVRIMEAIVRAARTGAKVELPPAQPPAHPTGDLTQSKPPTKKVETVNAPSPSK